MSAVSDILNRKGSKALTQILIFLVSFALALLVGGVLLLLQGHDNVFSVYYYLLIQPFTTWNGFVKVLTPAPQESAAAATAPAGAEE